MKKRGIIFGVALVLAGLLLGCGKQEVTLSLSYGERTGTYEGDMVDGVPDGYGKFVGTNADGKTWTYEGNFKNGHFEGEGKTSWETGGFELGTYQNDILVPLKGDAIKPMYAEPEKFEGRCVELIGKVFTTPEYGDGYIALQLWGDYKNSANNTIVIIYEDNEFKVKEGDYVKVMGIVIGKFEGKNAFGGAVVAPQITAREYAVVSYQDAVAPTLKSIELNKTVNQHGYSVTVTKVELAAQETRVYLRVINNGTDKFSLYSFNAKLVQNKKQFDKQDNWNADYPDIQTDLLVGNTTEGIIAFPAIEQKPFQLIFEARSDNWKEEFQNFVFDVPLP